MVKVGSFFAMSVGAFIFWQTMDKIHVWNALRQDEKEGRKTIKRMKYPFNQVEWIYTLEMGEVLCSPPRHGNLVQQCVVLVVDITDNSCPVADFVEGKRSLLDVPKLSFIFVYKYLPLIGFVYHPFSKKDLKRRWRSRGSEKSYCNKLKMRMLSHELLVWTNFNFHQFPELHHDFNSFEPAIAISVKRRLPVLYGLNWELEIQELRFRRYGLLKTASSMVPDDPAKSQNHDALPGNRSPLPTSWIEEGQCCYMLSNELNKMTTSICVLLL
ncbi:hypothetical protein SADUNF_Sadunf15G0077000 [Salix dunnii]|uniref:Uncharacterized protein n=1 Tax=Salix dunnii TaxID=1413687 RepID=A0A835MIP0_9ROSI|nr:hypothetical protein SADUNF_Sadunf15G0077000 [Salix dunnii]